MSDQKQQIRPGDANAVTRSFFDALMLEMRHFDGVLPSTRLNLYGESFDTPVMMAALSHLDNVRENGMAEMAKGAKLANAVNWAGMGSEAELEAMAATGARTIKIIKPYEDNDEIFKKIEHAERCGVLAVGMDLDHSFASDGNYDEVLGCHMRPKSREEIEAFVKATKLPFVIKGVLSEVDADKCLQAGVQGMVVSHHHGIMDYAIPPLMILPKIARLTEKKVPIFVDCGIQTGMDVFKALAFGADAVSAGRVVMPLLREQGAEGVRALVDRMTKELAGAMARTASASIDQIDPDLVWYKGKRFYQGC